MRLWTWSGVDYEKHFHADFTLYGCVDVSAVNHDPFVCHVYELRFEIKSLTPEIITVIFDGVGLKFSCRITCANYSFRMPGFVLLICEILYIFATINYEKMR